MAITCPNKNLKAWKALIEIYPEDYCYLLWNEYEGNVPAKFYTQSKETILSKWLKNDVLKLKPKYHESTYAILRKKLNLFNARFKSLHTTKRGKNIGESGDFKVEIVENWHNFDGNAEYIYSTTKDKDTGQITRDTTDRNKPIQGMLFQLPSEQPAKEGVDFVFKQNPELSSIGTQQQYSEYLDTIFPESKVKDILWHKSKSKDKFDKFDKLRTTEGVFFFNKDKSYYDTIIKDGRVVNVIVDFKSPENTPFLNEVAHMDIAVKAIKSRGNDSGIDLDNNEYIAFESEQIHILGSKQDIQGFKEFVAQDSQKQLPSEKSIEQVNQELNDKLKTLMSELGISVDSMENFQNNTGLDPVAIADIVNKIIFINEGRAKEDTLPEEVGHFIIELLGNNPLVERMLALVAKDDYYKVVLGDMLGAYEEAYGNNKALLIKEAAGQLLGKAIISNFSNELLQIPQQHQTLMQRIWNFFKNLFSPNRQSVKNWKESIIDVYGGVADAFLKRELQGLSTENLTAEDKLYQLSESRLNSLKTVVEEAKKRSIKRLEVYKRKDKTKQIDVEDAYLKELVKQFDDNKFLDAAVSTVEYTKSRYDAVNKWLKTFQGANGVLDADGLNTIANIIREMKTFNDSLTPTLNDLGDELRAIIAEDEESKELATKTLEIVRTYIDMGKDLNKKFYEIATPVFARFLQQYVGSGPLADIEEALKHVAGDITFWQRWFDSMAEVGDPILQLIDIAVKDAKMKAFDDAYIIKKELMQRKMDLEAKGIKSAEFVYEFDEEGNATGYLISEFNRGKFYNARRKFYENLNKKLGLPSDPKERAQHLDSNPDLRKRYNKEANKWMSENMQQKYTDSQLTELVARERARVAKGEISKLAFDDWYKDNIYEREDGSITAAFNGRYYIPANKYKNAEYAKIQNGTDETSLAKKEFLNYVVSTTNKLNKLLPEQYRLTDDLAPQLRKDSLERLKSIVAGKTENAKEALMDTFFNREDDPELGDAYRDKELRDENNKVVNFIPIHFTKRLRNPQNMSTDIVSALSAFAIMANDYRQLDTIVDILEVGRELVNSREIYEVAANGNVRERIIKYGDRVLTEKLKTKTKGNLSLDRLDSYYNMVIYGESRAEGKDFKLPWGEKVIFNTERMIDFVGKYTAINNLGLNVYAAMQNPLIGNAMIRIEGFAKEFVNNKDLFYAEGVMAKELPAVVASVGARMHTNKLDLWREYFDVMQYYGKDAGELDMERKTWLGKLFKSSALFFMNSIGEYYLQTKMSIALANQVQLKDTSGKLINLYEAYEVKGNKLVLKEGITKLDGSAWTNADTRAFKKKQNGINNSLHGVYNDVDRSAIQYYAMGRLALMFRKFIRPGLNRRYRKNYFNYEVQAYREGYYVTGYNFIINLIKDLKHGQFMLRNNWNNLTESQKANMFRVFTEVAYLLAATFLASLAVGLADGEDDDDVEGWALNMWAYQMNRLITELRFWWSPGQTFTILKSPAAGIDQLESLLNLASKLAPWNLVFGNSLEEITRGRYKGHTRLYKATSDVIPLWDTLADSWYPQEKMVFFNLN